MKRSLWSAEIQAWLGLLNDRWLWALLALGAFVLTLALQRPLRYQINVGQEDGPGADLPLLVRFNTPERDDHGRFRWTSERSVIHLPGLGRRAVELQLYVFPIGTQVAQVGPKVLQLWAANQTLALLPVRPEGAIYRLVLPPAALADGRVEVRSETFSPAGDPRQLGVPLTRVEVYDLGSGFVAPSLRLLLSWLLALILFWALLRRIGFASTQAFMLLLPVPALLALATALDPLRTALGAEPLLTTLVLCYGFALILLALVPALAHRLDLPLDQHTLAWLLLIVLLVAGLRYGGKMYPFAMPGDIGFHTNRFNDVIVRGQFVLIIPHRGIDLPYPPTFYILLAPLRLLGFPTPVLLQTVAAALDGISALLVYAIMTSARRHLGLAYRPTPALIAAALYSFSAAGFMATWWNFSTFIFSQFALLALVTTLVLTWPDVVAGRYRLALLAALTLFLLSHSTAPLNTILLATPALAMLLVWWRRPWARSAFVTLTVCLAVTGGLAFTIYYTNYLTMFAAQFQRLAGGGLTGLANREPVALDVLWRTLWQAGLIVHFGFFPLPLACVGLLLLADRMRGSLPSALLLPWLMALTLLVATGFALLPFVTGSTLATRYLMFSAWAVAVGAACTLDLLWRRGRAARLLVCVIGSFIVWISAAQWVAALAWRVRPPEPF